MPCLANSRAVSIRRLFAIPGHRTAVASPIPGSQAPGRRPAPALASSMRDCLRTTPRRIIRLSRSRVVAYDRAGLGWSDPGPAPRDARRIADELRAALRAAGIPPPYVLAGHSFGGLPARAFADLYPDEVVGLVLADASHPDQWARWPTRHADLMIAAAQQVTSWLARLGLMRLVDVSAAISAGLPPRQVGELRARSALPGAAATARAQLLAWRMASRAQVNGARGLGDLPLVVLGVGEQPLGAETLTALQAELPALSTNSARRVVPGATHESLLARREYALVVVEAIRQVLAAAAAGQPLAPAAPG
jgi:pimeloyl-ACP methyl ester carboxylesterase